ncbi:hypothetical protein L3X38_025185 [Prunus dulcis]|uniref:Retrotransposon gag domain-containing protein n=1 Tax=Prunus dulcis TaxID=3755 RepID=A0AAD4W351_PRUDU|nr:hypothetical protein L3X38_025185 [Prunus dulcis]
MILHKANDALICKVFAMTLQGAAQDWLHTLPSGSINSFKKLAYIFTKEYTSYRTIKKNPDHLYNLRKKSDESLRDYIKRFKAEKANIVGCDDRIASSAFKKGLPTEHNLYRELTITPSQTLAEVIQRIENLDTAKEPPQKVIRSNTILADSEESKLTSKEKKRKIKQATVISQVSIDRPPEEDDPVIGFQKKDLIGLDMPHNDALVISIQISRQWSTESTQTRAVQPISSKEIYPEASPEEGWKPKVDVELTPLDPDQPDRTVRISSRLRPD